MCAGPTAAWMFFPVISREMLVLWSPGNKSARCAI